MPQTKLDTSQVQNLDATRRNIPQTKDWSNPESIFLQVEGNDYEGYETITWSEDKINDGDVEYIRKDILHSELNRQKDGWIEKIEEMIKIPSQSDIKAVDYATGKIYGFNNACKKLIHTLKGERV